MKKFIVTTTINEPTEATYKFSKMKDWTLIVVGDKKTPHESYKGINCIYLHPKHQQKQYPKVSKLIGWNCIQRRNIGFLEAYRLGADIVATVDDDNIPYENWGKDCYVGQEVEVDAYEKGIGLADPLCIFSELNFWHRGFPIDFVPFNKNPTFTGKAIVIPMVQADLWDGDPDIDAYMRITEKPMLKFESIKPYCFPDQVTPFNSQNTFLHRDVLPFYAVLPYIGRLDDIWGAYLLQSLKKTPIIFNQATVYQQRNQHNLFKDLEKEYIGMQHNREMAYTPSLDYPYIPKKTKEFFEAYQAEYKSML